MEPRIIVKSLLDIRRNFVACRDNQTVICDDLNGNVARNICRKVRTWNRERTQSVNTWQTKKLRNSKLICKKKHWLLTDHTVCEIWAWSVEARVIAVRVFHIWFIHTHTHISKRWIYKISLLVDLGVGMGGVTMLVQGFFVVKRWTAIVTGTRLDTPVDYYGVSLERRVFFEGQIAIRTFEFTAAVSCFQILAATVTFIFRYWLYRRHGRWVITAFGACNNNDLWCYYRYYYSCTIVII